MYLNFWLAIMLFFAIGLFAKRLVRVLQLITIHRIHYWNNFSVNSHSANVVFILRRKSAASKSFHQMVRSNNHAEDVAKLHAWAVLLLVCFYTILKWQVRRKMGVIIVTCPVMPQPAIWKLMTNVGLCCEGLMAVCQ